jgi:hypothetical protein
MWQGLSRVSLTLNPGYVCSTFAPLRSIRATRHRQGPAVAEPAIKIFSLVIEWKEGTTRSQAHAADCDLKLPDPLIKPLRIGDSSASR